MPFQISPGVNVSEIDLTTGVIGVGTTAGAFAGVFKWGPALAVTLVDSETTLVSRFGKPDLNTFVSFFTAANFLQYGDTLNLVRVVSTAGKNSTANASGLAIINDDIYNNQYASGQGVVGNWAGKYVGDLGNSLKVAIADVGNWGGWAYAANFTGAPGTSTFAAAAGGTNDEIHVIVIDSLGKWTGIQGAILEVYPFCSKAADAKSADGTSQYYANVVNRKSQFVRWMDHPTIGTNWGSLAAGINFVTLPTTVTFATTTGTFTVGEIAFVGASFAAATKTGTVVSFTSNAATAATITSTLAGPYVISTGVNDKLKIAVDGAGPITVTLSAGSQTATQLAVTINAAIPGIAAGGSGSIVLTSTTTGASSEIDIQTIANSGYATLGFIVHSYFGTASSKTLVINETLGRFAASDLVTGHTSAFTGTVTAVTLAEVTDTLSGGVDGNDTIMDGDKIIGYGLFADTENVDASLILGADASNTVALSLISLAENRKDAVTFLSPPMTSVVANAGNEGPACVTFRNLLTSSSYTFMDSNWKYMYDKYNDTFRWVPLNGDIAGLAVRTDLQRDAWFSFAGLNRGQIKNVVKLAWNPNHANRDLLYKNGINPVVNFPGQGPVLFGDKTLLAKPSAFDRINVRRLFIVLEKAIATTAKFTLFEFNDEFTRAQFRNQVEPFLRDVQGRRGITAFLVVCDSTNNTPQVIDSNQFVGDIYIKPERSINYIQLNFVAVRTGVSFNEIVGQF